VKKKITIITLVLAAFATNCKAKTLPKIQNKKSGTTLLTKGIRIRKTKPKKVWVSRGYMTRNLSSYLKQLQDEKDTLKKHLQNAKSKLTAEKLKLSGENKKLQDEIDTIKNKGVKQKMAIAMAKTMTKLPMAMIPKIPNPEAINIIMENSKKAYESLANNGTEETKDACKIQRNELKIKHNNARIKEIDATMQKAQAELPDKIKPIDDEEKKLRAEGRYSIDERVKQLKNKAEIIKKQKDSETRNIAAENKKIEAEIQKVTTKTPQLKTVSKNMEKEIKTLEAALISERNFISVNAKQMAKIEKEFKAELERLGVATGIVGAVLAPSALIMIGKSKKAAGDHRKALAGFFATKIEPILKKILDLKLRKAKEQCKISLNEYAIKYLKVQIALNKAKSKVEGKLYGKILLFLNQARLSELKKKKALMQ